MSRIKKMCVQCKKEFESYICNNRKFCSAKCYFKYKKLGNQMPSWIGMTPWNKGKGFHPIDGFEGNFDGNNKEISELYINRDMHHNVGLFERLQFRFINSGGALKRKNFS